MDMSQWLYDTLSVFAFISLMSFLAFVCFFCVYNVLADVKKTKDRRKYYNSLDLEQRKVIDGYEAIDVPIFPRKKVKDNAK